MTSRIEIRYCHPDLLKPNPWNSNVVGSDMELRLEASLGRFGVYKPIICRELPGGELQILGGEHRARTAGRLGIAEVPYVNLGQIDDRKAKEIGLADNGRYGEDDQLKLADILKDLGQEVIEFLPFSDKDLAGMFAEVPAVDLDSLGFDDDAPAKPLEETVRNAITHELMRFKVPVESRERVSAFIQHVVKTRGLASEEDPMVAAGMALVEIVNAAKETL
jgi:ParB family chromosome partitioning protein